MLMKFFLKYKSMGRNIIKKIFSTPKSPKPLIYKNIKNYIKEKRNSKHHSQKEIYNILIKAKEAYLDCIEHNGVLMECVIIYEVFQKYFIISQLQNRFQNLMKSFYLEFLIY